jgi:hypothetical protein
VSGAKVFPASSLIVRRRRLFRFRLLFQARRRSQIGYPPRRGLPNGRSNCATAVAAGPVTNDDDADLAAMVIVLRNRKVNRISRLVTSPCAAGISAISHSTAQGARLHPVHREP